MKKTLCAIIALVILCASLAVPVSAAGSDLGAGNSTNASESLTVTRFGGGLPYNIDYHEYYNYSDIVYSYLTELDNGDFAAVSYDYDDNKVIIIRYNSKLSKYLDMQTVKAELPIFGGYFSGEKYNYLVFGQNNFDESDSVEVMRVVKYDKSWKRLGDTKIKGANTYSPFSAGSLRMTETGGRLYVYTCHKMYKHTDGYNHQANMTFVIDEETNAVADCFFDVMNIGYGYVSHSFNQFIATDGEYIYRADHGDAYPRGVSVTKCRAGYDITDVEYDIPLTFSGYIGDNYTGASVGGMELADNEILIAGNSEEKTESARNIFVISVEKSLNESKTFWLTDYYEKDNIEVGTPQLVKLGQNSFLLMWNETKNGGETVTKAVTLDSRGGKTSGIVKLSAKLSDCQPVRASDGSVKWYASDGSNAWFYSLDISGGSESKTVLGDADCDGTVTVSDVTIIQRYIAEYDIKEKFDKKAADVNKDGAVTIDDVTIIQRYLAEFVKKL